MLPQHEESTAYGVSADGQVIVGLSSSHARQAGISLDPEQGMQPLGDLPGGREDSSGRAVSRDGTVVVGNSSSHVARKHSAGPRRRAWKVWGN